MTLFSLSGILLACTGAGLAFILLKHSKSNIHYIWAFFNLAVVLWGIAAFFIGIAPSASASLLWWKLAHVGITFIPVFLYHFVLLLCKDKRKLFLTLVYFQAIFFSVLNLNSTLFSQARFIEAGFFYAIPSPAYIYYFLVWLSLVCLSHVKLVFLYFRSEGIRKNQILYLFIGSLVGFSGGLTNFMVAYGFNVHPIGNFTIPVYCLIVSYAILKYRLLEIPLVITRTGIFVAVYSVVLGVPFAIILCCKEVLVEHFNENWWVVPLALSTILATLGPFIYLFFQKKAEDRLLQEQRQYQATLRKASLGMGQIKDLNRLLKLIVHIVTKAVKIKHCTVYLYHESANQFVLKALKNKTFTETKLSALDPDNILIKVLSRTKEPIVFLEVKQKKVDYFNNVELIGLEKILIDLNAELVVPSFIENKLIAFIVLGQKKSNKMYTQDDLVVFSILASQSALAIENAMFYEDTKRTHAQLFKAEKMATIGTMADGLSHQINNRLHAMGFIAGDALDTLKRFKDKKVSKDTQKLLDNITNALTRIEDNVKRGGEIVQGLLTYTRKGEEGFTAVDLNKLLDASIEMVSYKIKTKSLDFNRYFNGRIPKIKGNFTQLQEVLFNIIDNSYDAIMQRKEEMKEPGFRGRINFEAKSLGLDKLELIVHDNGMGVKEESKKKIFTPFFTTKLSSKKGTGLGMYVIKQIIEENHRGKVTFSSTYKEGSKTRILLPIYASKS